MSVVISHLFWWFLHVCYENLGLDLITELHTVHKLAEICLSLIFSFLGGSWFWLLIFHLFVCYTEFKMQNFIYVFFPQIIAAVLYVQIFKLYKTQKFFKKHFFYLNCFVTQNINYFFNFSLLLIKKTPDKFPRSCGIDLLLSLLPTGAGFLLMPVTALCPTFGVCTDALVLRATTGAKSPLQAGSQSSFKGLWGDGAAKQSRPLFFCKMQYSVFGVFLLFVNSLLFVSREILIFLKTNIQFWT